MVGVLLTVPIRDVLVRDAGRNIEHDDTALAVDVVTVTKATKFLLACGVPDIELDHPISLLRLVTATNLAAGLGGVEDIRY